MCLCLSASVSACIYNNASRINLDYILQFQIALIYIAILLLSYFWHSFVFFRFSFFHFFFDSIVFVFCHEKVLLACCLAAVLLRIYQLLLFHLNINCICAFNRSAAQQLGSAADAYASAGAGAVALSTGLCRYSAVHSFRSLVWHFDIQFRIHLL